MVWGLCEHYFLNNAVKRSLA